MTDHQTARRLAALDQVLILTHRRPDGDTIGCASALCLALRQLGKTAWVLPNEDAHGLFTPYLEGVLAGTLNAWYLRFLKFPGDSEKKR